MSRWTGVVWTIERPQLQWTCPEDKYFLTMLTLSYIRELKYLESFNVAPVPL